MELLFGIIIGVVALTILVALHELGHGIVARRNGVVVEEFGIGFPPKAWSKKVKYTILGKNVEYSINWLPLGGFVKLQGEHDAADKKGDYGAASFWVKTKILLAGVLINWLTAALLFTMLALVGLPKLIDNQVRLPFDTRIEQSPLMVAQVTSDSPAAKAGLQVDDEIVKIDAVNIESAKQLSETTKSRAGETVNIAYVRDGVAREVTAMLNTPERAKNGGYLGVTSSQAIEKSYSTWSAPIVSVR